MKTAITNNPVSLEPPILKASECTCRREPSGRLNISFPGGEFENVHMVPTFPLSCRGRMVAVLNAEGEEVAMLDRIGGLEPSSRRVAIDELERSYFMPRILLIEADKEELGVLTLDVLTDRGPRTVQIRNPRRSFRKLPNNRVAIRDVDGNRYEIRDWTNLDSYARELIGQYL